MMEWIYYLDFVDQDEYIDTRNSYDGKSLASTNISMIESNGGGQTPREQLGISMSSMGGESLQEIWKLLEDRPTPTPRSPLRKGNSSIHFCAIFSKQV